MTPSATTLNPTTPAALGVLSRGSLNRRDGGQHNEATTMKEPCGAALFRTRHHVASFAVVELRMEVSNLVLLCEPCHYWVHGADNTLREFIEL